MLNKAEGRDDSGASNVARKCPNWVLSIGSEMANTKASKKDIRRIAKRTVQNNMVRVSLKTYVKKARKATASGDPVATQETLLTAVKALDKAAQNGVIHPNQAARNVSTLPSYPPSSYLRPGTFLLAHPQIRGCFARSVVCGSRFQPHVYCLCLFQRHL